MLQKLLIDDLDYNRESLSLQKIVQFFRVLFLKQATQVLESVGEFGDIDFKNLGHLGKQAIILDVDECIAPHHGYILPKNLEIITKLVSEGWKIVIFSNMKKSHRYIELENIGIQVVTSKYAKPDRRGFGECLQILGVGPQKTVMIGDNFLTDGGCLYLGIDFIKVKPLQSISEKKTLQRALQIYTGRIIDTLAYKRHKINLKNNEK